MNREISYVSDKSPQTDSEGRTLYLRAPELEYDWSANFWERINLQIESSGEKTNCQVVVLNAYYNDVGHQLLKSLRHLQLGKFPVATTVEQEFPDRELKILLDQEAIRAHSVYLIASILNERDFSRVRKVADHYKNTLNAKFVTLICPYLSSTREDKNITSKGEYEPSVTSIRAEIGGLSPFVDRMIVIEPHSSATQAYAAEFGIPLAPISPWKLFADNTPIDPKNSLVIRPDKGRNLAATRIGNYLNIPFVSFEKVRVSGQAVTLFELSEEEKALVRGKDCIAYDDEASTMGTVYALAEALQSYGARSLSLWLVHCKFTPGWETKIRHPLFSTILGTDSRQPIGNINVADNIKIISLETLIRKLIEADIKGVNFWTDSQYKDIVLQEE